MEEIKTQEGVLVLKQMPEFKMEAYNAESGNYTEVSSEDYKGKWTVICFYPADFTFVCPTELKDLNEKLVLEFIPTAKRKAMYDNTEWSYTAKTMSANKKELMDTINRNNITKPTKIIFNSNITLDDLEEIIKILSKIVKNAN